MSTRKPQVLYTPSYWADFHRRCREREARAARTPTAIPGAIRCHDHGLVYTFTPTRAAPFIAVVQNDGRLLNINNGLPVAVLPMPPPPPKPKAPKPSATALRAKALLDACPTKDEELLARFAVSRARNDAAKGSSKCKTALDPPAAKDGKRPVNEQAHGRGPSGRVIAAEGDRQFVVWLLSLAFMSSARRCTVPVFRDSPSLPVEKYYLVTGINAERICTIQRDFAPQQSKDIGLIGGNNLRPHASPSDRSFHAAATVPAGKLAYAVRCDGMGEIYDEYGPAHDHYHGLQHLGRHPVLAVHKSLTAAVSFVEEGTGHRPRHPSQREHWIQEELLACAVGMPPSSPSLSEESDLTESLQEE
ncbi:hypothetical protein B0H14DRAFT_3705629 [Mycena olivaceomarginata]|nr:hypothetical protein B0H14DRAFT_3705629 [Mycena olivaceomarginata]